MVLASVPPGTFAQLCSSRVTKEYSSSFIWSRQDDNAGVSIEGLISSSLWLFASVLARP